MKQNRKPGIHLHSTLGKGTAFPKEYYWILIAKNGKTIAKSSETYKTKRAAVRSIKVVSNIIRFVSPGSLYDHTKKGTEQVVY